MLQTPVMEDNANKLGCSSRLLDITVLMGGPSAEREISLLSGHAIADALARLGHRITRADISPRDTSAIDRDGVDVVFIALHGEFGESGQVQQLCEQRGICYTGSDAPASELAMEKDITKSIASRAGIATPKWKVVRAGEDWEKSELLPLPVVVKPTNGGSSLDITIARTSEQKQKALGEVLDKYAKAMLEEFIPGREMTVGILGDNALPVLEVIPDAEFYDFDAKYSDDAGTRYVFDHGLDYEIVQRLKEDALKIHRLLGCKDFSRVDFILGSDGIGQMIEINTIPGFTSHSLLPMSAERAGVSFDELVGRIVELAMTRCKSGKDIL